MIFPTWFHLLWIIPGFLYLLYLGSPRYRGTLGVSRLQHLLSSHLEKNIYTTFIDLKIPGGGGTRDIDIVIVSQFGVFVISGIYRKGLISGTEVQDRWKQTRFGRVSQFDNPLHKNYLDLQALRRLLDLPESRFHSIVGFSGIQLLSKDIPSRAMEDKNLVPFIRTKRRKLLGSDEANKVIEKLTQTSLNAKGAKLPDRLTVLKLVSLAVLSWLTWVVYQDTITNIHGRLTNSFMKNVTTADEETKMDVPLTRKQWEETLNCAYSSDSERCACHDENGKVENIQDSRCQELAERGSVLKQ